MPGQVNLSLDSLLHLLAACRVYDLEQPRYHGIPNAAPHAPGFVYMLHRRHESGTGEDRTSASGMIVSPEHAGTHIDALCHQAENMRMYGGVEIDSKIQTSTGFTELGADTIAPMLGRGVLLDVAANQGVERLPDERLISAHELQQVAKSQGTSIREGDVVLVRIGNGAAWHDPDAYLRGAGMVASASQWLADLKVRAVGADNVAWDLPDLFDAEMGMTLPGHVILLVRHGIYILEHLFLEELARDRIYEFAFVCLPLKMRGATASPVRPIAISL